ncbi:MAG: AraC family transcriptional regulator [Ferruginibacter sp.]
MEQYPKIYLYRRIVQAKLFIDNNYAQPIDLGNIAGEACFSKFHFIRLFKNIYNKTPHQYLTTVRIEKAKLLLSQGNNIVDVCYSVGFDSISSFTALFKRIAALTPATYQQQQTIRASDISSQPLRYVPNCFAEKIGYTEK